MDTARRLLARDDEDEDPSPWEAAADVAKNKISRFEGQSNKSSKFHRERQAEAERARKEAEEAARAYQEFIATFGGEDEHGPSTSSRPRVGAGVKTAGKGFVRAGGDERYNPLADRPAPPPSAPAAYSSSVASDVLVAPSVPTGPRAMNARPAARPTAVSLMGADDEPDVSFKATGPPGRKKREGANFLEQLKRDQAAREERLKLTAGRTGASVTALAARENAPVLTGSFDTGDPLTTNLHVGGLPQNVTEESLGKLFAQFGPVGSVKIMWPRMDSGQLNPLAAGVGGRKLGGFVAFLRRPDAERAAKEMDGAEWGEAVIKISWGKAIPIPARALYEPEAGSSRARRDNSRSRSRSRSPDDPMEFLRSKRRRSSRSRSPPTSARSARAWPDLEEGVDDRFLTTVAKKVRDNGKAFEDVLRDKEENNPRFAFLKDEALPSYHYFRMLIDPAYDPPQNATFDDEGSADVYSSDSSEDSDSERAGKGQLGRLAQRRFESLLRGLTSSRDRIARGMSFALEHADCAAYIVDLLVCALTIDATPVPRKVARLHLVSDILHNSAASVPNAWVYRSLFEAKLPAVFDHLGDIYLSFPGRLKAEQFKGLVEKVVDVWENDWMLFEPAIVEDLRQRLSGLDVSPTVNSAAQPETNMDMTSMPPVAPVTFDAAPEGASGPAAKPAFKSSFRAAAFAPAEPRDLMQEAAGAKEADEGDEDVDGAAIPMDEVEEDLDGAPAESEDELDGMPVGQSAENVSLEVESAPSTELASASNTAEEADAVGTVVIHDGGNGNEDGESMELSSDDDIFT
ncbi:hypothetical protein JCM11641_004738 [Rhodosporidiobolus odoratus]